MSKIERECTSEVLTDERLEIVSGGELAARQLHALRAHHSGKLRIHDVKEMFLQIKDYA